MSYADQIKAKIKELDLETQLGGLVDEGEKLVQSSVTKAGDLAHGRRGDVEGWLDKASELVNDKTDAKYVDHVEKIRAVLLGGVDRVAAKRSGADDPTEPSEPIALEAPQQETDRPDQE